MFARPSPPSARGFAARSLDRPGGEGLAARLGMGVFVWMGIWVSVCLFVCGWVWVCLCVGGCVECGWVCCVWVGVGVFVGGWGVFVVGGLVFGGVCV